MKKVAIITARGGSKRIPKKNAKLFLGKPIIAYVIEVAIVSGLFDEIMVSTDDPEIAGIAEKYGARVPFFRSERNADDYATTYDVIKEVLNDYLLKGISFAYGCCIYPTAVFTTPELLLNGWKKLKEGEFDIVFPILPYSYPIWRSLKLEKGRLSLWWPENAIKRSQDLPKAFHDAGQFYWFGVDAILSKGRLFSDNAAGLPISEFEAHDIDNQSDWEMAVFKYKYREYRRQGKNE